MSKMITPKINNPQNFKSSNTLVTTRQPHYATKIDTAFNIIPGMHRPNANGAPNNLDQHDFIGPEFKARPLKHWRRQLVPTNPSNTNDSSTQKRMSRVYFMETPGSTIYKKNKDTCKCIVDNVVDSVDRSNSFEIAESFNKNNIDTGIKVQNNGQINIPLSDSSVNETNYHIYTGVFDSRCIACNPQNNVIKSGITTQSQAYYGSKLQYLESRCRTYAQRESTTKLPNGTYYPNPTNIPFIFLYPNDNPQGPQVYEPKNCANPKIYNDNALNTPPNNYCRTIYKPNNPQFARQGAVSGSTRIQKLKSDTITSNGFSYYSAYGATMANAGNFQGTNESNNYFVKNRNYPLTGFHALDKYRQHKLSGCCIIAPPVIVIENIYSEVPDAPIIYNILYASNSTTNQPEPTVPDIIDIEWS